MDNYRLVESFEIDDGSLDGVSVKKCFGKGAQWSHMRARLLSGEQFTTLCLAENADRLARLAERHGRFVEHHPECRGWVKIFVGAPRG